MVLVVLAAQVVHVGGADHRQASVARDPHGALVDDVLLGDPVLLQLDVDVLGPEDLDEVVDVLAGDVGAILDERLREGGGQAAGEGDNAVGVLLQERHVDGGLAAAHALQEPADERRTRFL